jgi:cell division septation protein DedD
LIFAAGVLLLLGAFWAGLTVTRKGPESTAQAAPSPAVQPATPTVSTGQQPAPAIDTDPEARYVVVVAIFGTEERAKELTVTLRKKNYVSTHVEAAAAPTGNKVFRVMIGPYDRREKAEQVANELTAEGRKGIKIEKGSS